MLVQEDSGRLPVLVVDEIGKMQWFSKKFQSALVSLIQRDDVTALVTLPKVSAKEVEEAVVKYPSTRWFEVAIVLALNLAYLSGTLIRLRVTSPIKAAMNGTEYCCATNGLNKNYSVKVHTGKGAYT